VKPACLAVALAAAVACGSRDRVNAACEWTRDPAFALDLGNGDHQDHLGTDADLVADLAIRYADATAGRMASPNWARQRDSCRAKLAAIVAARHDIAVEHVLDAAGRRSPVFMGAVAVAFLLVFTGFCRTLVPSLFDSWSHRGVVGEVAIAVISVAVATGATAAGAMWTGASEMVRLGNEHVSGRLRSFPFKTYFSLLFVASLAIFWVVAWRPFRRAMTKDTPPRSRSMLQ
jgi:hypothetical protein